jgi:predicted phosphodiesterase
MTACAIISDVHANLEALTTVLSDIHTRFGDVPIHCLGDIVDYGPQPAECIARVRESCKVVIAGNHDVDAAISKPRDAFGRWTQTVLDNGSRLWLGSLPMQHHNETFVAAHGMPLDDTYHEDRKTVHYLRTSAYIDLADDLGLGLAHDTLSYVTQLNNTRPTLRIAAFGHTHIPFILTLDGEPTSNLPDETMLEQGVDSPTLLCVPSVGVPRDGDPRTGYAFIDNDNITLVRIPYDIDKTVGVMTLKGCPSGNLINYIRHGCKRPDL